MSLDLSWPALQAKHWDSGCFSDSCNRGLLSWERDQRPAESVQDQDTQKQSRRTRKNRILSSGDTMPRRWITFFVSNCWWLRARDHRMGPTLSWVSEEDEDRKRAQLSPGAGGSWIDPSVHRGLAVTAGRTPLLITAPQPRRPSDVQQKHWSGRQRSKVTTSDIGYETGGKKGLGEPVLSTALGNKRKEMP